MRLFAAERFKRTDWMFEIVVSKRFIMAPKRDRACETRESAVSRLSSAARALPALPLTEVDAPIAVLRSMPPKLIAMRSESTFWMPIWKASLELALVMSCFPLNFVEVMMRLASACRFENSVWMNARSELWSAPFAPCVASSRMRSTMFDSSPSAPSAVCAMLIASPALRSFTVSVRTCDLSDSLIARPAASSFAVLMRRPLDNLLKVDWRADWDL